MAQPGIWGVWAISRRSALSGHLAFITWLYWFTYIGLGESDVEGLLGAPLNALPGNYIDFPVQEQNHKQRHIEGATGGKDLSFGEEENASKS